jgi:hypothetical protein
LFSIYCLKTSCFKWGKNFMTEIAEILLLLKHL